MRGHDPLYAGNLLEALQTGFRQIMPMYSIQEEQYYAYDGNEGDYSNDYENVDSAWKASCDYSEDGYYDDGAYDAPEHSDYQSRPCIYDCVYAYDYNPHNPGWGLAFYCGPTLRNGAEQIMFLNSSGPPQRTHPNDVLQITEYVAYVRKETQRHFYDRGYSHGFSNYESNTKNAYSQGLHDGQQIARTELQKAYSSGFQQGQNQRPPISSSNTGSFRIAAMLHQSGGCGLSQASYPPSSAHVKVKDELSANDIKITSSNLPSQFELLKANMLRQESQQVANFAALHSQLDNISSKFTALHDRTNQLAVTVAYLQPRSTVPTVRASLAQISSSISPSTSPGKSPSTFQAGGITVTDPTPGSLLSWICGYESADLDSALDTDLSDASHTGPKNNNGAALSPRTYIRILSTPTSRTDAVLQPRAAPASASFRRLRLFHRAPDPQLRCAPPRSSYRAPASASPHRLPLLRARASVSTRLFHRAQVLAYNRRRRA